MNASGVYIPPVLIFPRKNMKAELMIGAPAGAVAECHISGWVQTDIFTRWFKHFIKFAKPTAADPVLLVLDGHFSHTRNIELIDLAKENHVTIICLPPHSTNKMQPLDVAFMSPLKTFYAQEIENWLRENQLNTVSQYGIASIFCKAYNRAATMETSCNGFRKTGLVPLNRHVFRDHDFGVHNVMENKTDTQELLVVELHQRAHSNDQSQNDSISFSTQDRNERTPSPPSANPPQRNYFSPIDICPLPQHKNSEAKSNSRAGKASVITLTPYKKELQESLEKKQAKKIPKKNISGELKPEGKITKKSAKESTSVLQKNPISRQDQPSTSGLKRRRRKRQSSSSSSSESDNSFTLADSSSDESGGSDAECLFCTGKFSEDKHGEQWAKCSYCDRWAHEECGETKDSNFICSFCERRVFFE
nr:unnamed protein product [Callosobruchus chinensis]